MSLVFLVCCQGDKPAQGPQTCEDLTKAALKVLNDAATSVTQCTSPSDCTPIEITADCWSSCVFLVGNDAVASAIAAKRGDIAKICNQFHAAGCQVTEGGCPGGPSSYSCDLGQCVGH